MTKTLNIEINDEYTKYINKAINKGNINAYGWFMRYMQIEDDLDLLIKEHNKLKNHIDRCVEELK